MVITPMWDVHPDGEQKTEKRTCYTVWCKRCGARDLTFHKSFADGWHQKHVKECPLLTGVEVTPDGPEQD